MGNQQSTSTSAIDQAANQLETDGQQSFLSRAQKNIAYHQKKLEQSLKQFSQERETSKRQVCQQIKKCQQLLNNIQSFGTSMTDFKFQYITKCNYDYRVTGLLFITMLNGVFAFSRRSSKHIGIDQYGRVMRTFKVAAFTYFIGGLMIAPEIYNPLMVGSNSKDKAE